MTIKQLLLDKKILLTLSICYTIALTVVSLISLKSSPVLGTDYDDKIFHTIAYVILVLVWYFALFSFKIAKPILIVVLCSIIFGIIIEVLQGQFTLARHFDAFDIIANTIGITIATLFLTIRNRTIVKNL